MGAKGICRLPARARAGLVLLLVVTAAPGLAAATGPPTTIELDLVDVQRIVLERSRDIRRAEQYGLGVRGRYLEEKAAALPQVNLASGYSHTQDGSTLSGDGRTDLVSLAADFSQPLYTWGRIPAAIRAAEVGLAMAEDRMRQARQGSLRDALLAWYDALLAAELLTLAAENLAQKERLLGEARKKLAAGTATDYDVLAAEVSLENARPEFIRAENQVRTARERLRFLLALEEGTLLVLRGRLEVRTENPPAYPAVLETALRRRPDLAETRNRRRVAGEVVTITRAGTKPRLDLSGSAGWQRLEVDDASESGALLSAGVWLSWPLYDGLRVRGQVMQAESDAATLAVAEAELIDSIALAARRAVDAVQEAAGITEALTGTVAQAERLLALAEKGYEFGVKTRLDVDDAQLNLVQARGNLARAARDYLAARTILDWVTGTLGE